QRRVRDLADRPVAEPEAAAARALEELLSGQAREELVVGHLTQHQSDRLAVELLAADGRVLEESSLILSECVEARLEEGVDRGRDREIRVRWRLGEQGDHLLDVERVSLRALGDPVPRLLIEFECAAPQLDQLEGLLVAERMKEERGAAALVAGPAGAVLEQLG